MKKKVLLLTLLFIIIGGVLGVYLNRTLILNKVKTEILKKIEPKIGRSISIGKIEYKILKGIVINDLEISESAKQQQPPFIKIKQLSFSPVLFPFILKKKIVIPSINIDSLNANVIRLDKNMWNFSDLIKAASSEEKESKFSVVVLRIAIRNSEISFQDNTLSSPFSKRLKNVNLTLKPSLPKDLSFDLAANIDKTDSEISIEGKFDLTTKSLQSSINISDLLVTDYLVYSNNLTLLSVKDGRLTAKINAEYNNGRLNLKGTQSFKDLYIQKDKIQAIADLTADSRFTFDASNKDNPFDYSSNINLIDTEIMGLSYLKVIDNLNGKISISPDMVSCKGLTGNFAENVLDISGSLKDFKNPYLDARINSDISLAALKEIFQDEINLKDTEINGDALIDLSIKGALSDPNKLDIQGKIKLSSAKVNTPYLPDAIDNIQTDIVFAKDKISWKNLTANFKGDKLTSKGSLQDFSNPQVKLDISSDSANLTADFNIQNGLLKIAKLNGNFLNSKFDIKGGGDITNAENPFLNLSANVSIQLKELGDLNPNLKESLSDMKLDGILNAQADLSGRLKDYRNWQLALNGKSALLSIYGLKINDVNLNYSKVENSPFAHLQLKGQPYSGKLLIESQIDFSGNDIPFDANVIINDVDISKLKNDTGLRDKDISGLLQAQANLKGSGKNIKDSLNGTGALLINNGNLWELELLKSLGKLLLIPEFRKIVFKEASGEFSVANNKISTNNLMLESENVNILFEGYLDFIGNINFTVTTQLTEGLIKDITDVKGILNTILAQSTNAVVIKLTGTLNEPKHKFIPVPISIFKKSKKLFIDGLIEDIVK